MDAALELVDAVGLPEASVRRAVGPRRRAASRLAGRARAGLVSTARRAAPRPRRPVAATCGGRRARGAARGARRRSAGPRGSGAASAASRGLGSSASWASAARRAAARRSERVLTRRLPSCGGTARAAWRSSSAGAAGLAVDRRRAARPGSPVRALARARMASLQGWRGSRTTIGVPALVAAAMSTEVATWVGDLHAEDRLDLVGADADGVVGPVEQQVAVAAGDVEHLQGLEGDLDVLEGRARRGSRR